MYQKENKNILLRPAIAMIELIFAIVIIGITLLSAPLILTQSIQSSHVAMQQEAISAAASQISLILTRAWDEQDSNGTFGILRVSTIGGDSELAQGSRNSDGDLNMSRSYQPGLPKATAIVALGFDPVEHNVPDDVDDFNGLVQNLTLYTTGETAELKNNEGEYIDKQFQMTNSVTYANDNTKYNNDPVVFNNPFTIVANMTNIKIINVRLQSTENPNSVQELQKNISLSAFVCNIGNAANAAALPFVP